MKYIESLRRTGYWFDGKRHAIRTDEKLVPDFAPKYVLEHKEEFKELLVHPDQLEPTQ